MDARTIRPAWAEVDLDALSHNIREVRRLTSKDSKILAAVKADDVPYMIVSEVSVHYTRDILVFFDVLIELDALD